MDGPLATIAVAVIGSTPGMVVKRWLAALARCHSISCRSNASTRTVRASILVSYPFDLFVQLNRGEARSLNRKHSKILYGSKIPYGV
jgi:hypothetical protein